MDTNTELLAALARIAELEAERDKAHQDAISAAVERDALRTRLAEIDAQEPVVLAPSIVSGPEARTLAGMGQSITVWFDKPETSHPGRGHCQTPLYALPVPEQAVPDGWRLVPVEPTQEMIEAGKDVKRRRLLAAVEAVSAGKRHDTVAQAMAVNEEWGAMIAAAPEAAR